MNISSSSMSYLAMGLERLLSGAASGAGQSAPTGQEAPSSGEGGGVTAAASPATPASFTPFAGGMMSGLLDLQQAPPSSSDAAAQLISSKDTDADGQLSLAEVKTAVGDGTDAASGYTQSVESGFAKLDANGDGQLSASELASALDSAKASGGHHHHHHMRGAGHLADALMQQMDTDQSGGISLDEAASALGEDSGSLSAGFARLDANGDGQLGAGELKSALAAYWQGQAQA